mmetsp:Transcript_32706/g.77063  ORF Transcript_32706/g.77063 Transcript_32706/m.77063 type:complete len:229 (-) Transcript_32706:333-1019(-)
MLLSFASTCWRCRYKMPYCPSSMSFNRFTSLVSVVMLASSRAIVCCKPAAPAPALAPAPPALLEDDPPPPPPPRTTSFALLTGTALASACFDAESFATSALSCAILERYSKFCTASLLTSESARETSDFEGACSACGGVADVTCADGGSARASFVCCRMLTGLSSPVTCAYTCVGGMAAFDALTVLPSSAVGGRADNDAVGPAAIGDDAPGFGCATVGGRADNAAGLA